jgi:hypothetical protein
MKNDEFYPIKIKKSKLYIDITLQNIRENYHIKESFFYKLRKIIKKILKK